MDIQGYKLTILLLVQRKDSCQGYHSCKFNVISIQWKLILKCMVYWLFRNSQSFLPGHCWSKKLVFGHVKISVVFWYYISCVSSHCELRCVLQAGGGEGNVVNNGIEDLMYFSLVQMYPVLLMFWATSFAYHMMMLPLKMVKFITEV